MEKILLDLEFIKDIENLEAQYWSEYYICCRSPLTERIGINIKIIGGAMCCSIAKIDTLALNRVIGIGLTYPIKDEILNDIINFYKKSGVKRFFLQISPAVMPGSFNDILERNGFEYYNNWAKFYRELDGELPFPETNIVVEELALSDTDTFDEIMNRSFGFNDGAEVLFTQSYQRPGWKHYIAREDSKPVAAASLFVCGKYASLAIAGTVPEARGKGAQGALITRRINDAYNAGCKYLIVETSEDKPDKPSASYRNMKRFGFELAYLRPNYIYYLEQK